MCMGLFVRLTTSFLSVQGHSPPTWIDGVEQLVPKTLIWWSDLIVSMFIYITTTILFKFLKGATRHIDAVLLFFNTFHSLFNFFTKGSRCKFSAFSSIILTNPPMIGFIPIVLSVLDSP